MLIKTMGLLLSKWVPIFMRCIFSMGAYYPDFTEFLHALCTDFVKHVLCFVFCLATNVITTGLTQVTLRSSEQELFCFPLIPC